MSRQRKHVPGPEKLAILKRRLVEKTPISDLCDEYRLQPSQIYYWQSEIPPLMLARILRPAPKFFQRGLDFRFDINAHH